MDRTKHTLDQVVEAIRGSSGIKMSIAKKLGVHRNSIDNYLNRWPSARLVYVQEVETVGDMAESVIVQALRNGDVDTAKWYARVKLQDRGYAERIEHTGVDGGDILIREIVIERPKLLKEAS